MIQDLRQKYPKEVYFGLFENRKVGVAYKTILTLLGTKEGDALSDDKKRRARIVLFGHSWGASAVVSLSRKFQRAGIPVTLTIQIDSVAKPFQNDWLIPANVLQAVNFYQTHGLIHGLRKIVPVDPVHTTVLGNFLWEYKGEPAECYGFSWRGRLLSKGHTQIECDHKVWLQVKALLGRHLPNPVVTQSDAGEPALRPSGNDRDASQQDCEGRHGRRLTVPMYWMWRKGWDCEQRKHVGSQREPGNRQGVRQITDAMIGNPAPHYWGSSK
jgi:pimeloyl-ACP methyl ester carboxylesterase